MPYKRNQIGGYVATFRSHSIFFLCSDASDHQVDSQLQQCATALMNHKKFTIRRTFSIYLTTRGKAYMYLQLLSVFICEGIFTFDLLTIIAHNLHNMVTSAKCLSKRRDQKINASIFFRRTNTTKY